MDPELLASWEVQRDHAELALNSGDAARALAISEELLAVPELADVAELYRSVRTVAARAHETAGDLEGAIQRLERLVAEGPHDELWIGSLIDLSRCYRYVGDLNRAIDVGERAWEPIRELGTAGIGEGLRLTVTVAAAYFFRGDVVYAMQLCRAAIEDAERAHATSGLAAAYWNLASMQAQRNGTEQALPMMRKALAMFEGGEDARNLARLRTTMGTLELRMPAPDLEAAVSTLRLAERELAWSSASTSDQAGNLTSLAEAHILLGDLAAAEDEAARALALVEGSNPIDEASAHAVRGRIAFAHGDREAALTSYRTAIACLTSIGADRQAGATWFEVGSALERLGATAEAMSAYRSAAVSAGVPIPPERVLPAWTEDQAVT